MRASYFIALPCVAVDSYLTTDRDYRRLFGESADGSDTSFVEEARRQYLYELQSFLAKVTDVCNLPQPHVCASPN